MDDEINYTLGKQQAKQVYSAPRRYDLATMLVVTTAFALLFTVMTLLDAPLALFLYFVGLIFSIGIAQSLLSDAFSPRAISMVVGTLCLIVVVAVISFLFSHLQRGPGLPQMAISTVFLGPVHGYLSGALVAGTFLVADLLRKFLKSISFLNRKQSEGDESPQKSPWDD